MKNGLLLLGVFLNIGLVNCAHSMGRQRCDAPVLPNRPQQQLCIANSSGGGACFDPRRNPSEYPQPSINNFVCSNAFDNDIQEQWIEQVLKACGH